MTMSGTIVGMHGNRYNKLIDVIGTAVIDGKVGRKNPLFLFNECIETRNSILKGSAKFISDVDPTKKVLYVTGQEFVKEFSEALEASKQADDKMVLPITVFREKYRNTDVLLMNDIACITEKESTQEELFHMFNHLCALEKSIILSDEKTPHNLELLEERLCKRFESGILIDILSWEPNELIQ